MTHIDSDGKIVCRRNFEHVVPHVVGLTVLLRCNNAVELIFSGREAYAVMIYITSYVHHHRQPHHRHITITSTSTLPAAPLPPLPPSTLALISMHAPTTTS